MRLILRSALKDLRRIRRDPIALGTWLGIPLLVGVVLMALFGREEPKPHGLLLLADRDGTFVSSLLARAYTQGKLGEMISVSQVSLAEGRRRIAAGDASALLVIPEGFSQAVLRSEPVKLELVTNPAQAILPGIIQEVTTILVEGAWYLQQFVGEDLRRFADQSGSPPDAMVAAASVKFRHVVETLRKYADPPLIEVVSGVVRPGAAPTVNLRLLMFPGMIYMAVLFLAFGLGADIWEEKRKGTLRRILATPCPVTHFLAGKLLALAVVYALLGVVALFTGVWLVGIQAASPVLAVLWLAATGTGIYLALVVMHTMAASARAATVVSNIVIMVLCMLGGTFFPFEMMPEFLARIGRLTPNGWALLRFREILDGQAGAATVVWGFAGLAVVLGLLFAVAARRLRRNFAV
jgi:ABC-2 type transport system permease protein